MTIKQNRNLGAQLWSFYEGTTSLKYYVRNTSTANLIADRRYLLQYTGITASGGFKAVLYSIDVCQLSHEVIFCCPPWILVRYMQSVHDK